MYMYLVSLKKKRSVGRSIVGGRSSAVGRRSVVDRSSAVGRRSVVGGRSVGRPIGLPVFACLFSLLALLVF